MLTAKQIAAYADVVFRWLATKTARCRPNAERCRVLSEPQWACASAIDFEYYAKCLHEEITVSNLPINGLVIHQSEDHDATFELKGPAGSVRFPVRTRTDLALRFSELLFPELDANEILSLARNPLQTTERLQERQLLVEHTIDAVIHAEQDYLVRGAGIVIHDKRIEKRLVFRNRGPWSLRLSVELLNDDTYECTHDAGKLRLSCTEDGLHETIAAALSNGFAEAIRQNRRDSVERMDKFSRFLAPVRI